MEEHQDNHPNAAQQQQQQPYMQGHPQMSQQTPHAMPQNPAMMHQQNAAHPHGGHPGQQLHMQQHPHTVPHNPQMMQQQYHGPPHGGQHPGQHMQQHPGQHMQQHPGHPQGMPPGQWMQPPGGAPGCPPGLEYLTMIDQILVHQVVELLEAFTGFETANRYAIKNSMGQQIYFANEESDACVRQMCSNQRGFIMHITDNMNREVIRVEREFKCCAGANHLAFCEACQMEIRVEAPPGTHIGTVRQQWSLIAPKYSVMDAGDNSILDIEGPACMPCPQFCEIEFEVLSKEGQPVGKIKKQVAGLVQEMFTTADNFGITFPMDLAVNVKATLLGAVFLIDFMYFEQKQQNNNHH